MSRMDEKSYRHLSSLIGVVVTCGIFACGGQTSSRDDSETPLRAGGLLEPISLTYNDEQPVVSADGTKIVFASGRQTTDAAFSVKLFKVDWAADGVPAAPARLTTTDDLGLERLAAISADGAWVAVTSNVSARTDLYLQKYSGDAAVRVTDDVSVESQVSFSPDGKLLAWVSGGIDAEGKATSTVRVVEIGGGTADELARSQAVTIEGVTSITTAFWVANLGADYRLAVGTTDSTTGLSTLSIVSFADVADVADATATVWREGVRLDEKVPTAIGGDQALFTEVVLASAMRSVPRAGDFEEETPPSMQMSNQVTAGSVGSADVTEAATPAGYKILATGLSANGDTSFVLANQAYRCAPDGVLTYRSGLAVTNGGAIARLVPRLTADGLGFEVATDFCDNNRADDSVGRIDDRIEDFVVNANATSTVQRIIYVTRFATVFDANCGLKMGDREIYGFDIKAGASGIVAISNNKAPLTSADRGTQPACAL